MKDSTQTASDCPTCEGIGYYLDAGCVALTCAHGGRRRSPSEMRKLRKAAKPGDLVATHEPLVMLCPSRICSCPAGDAPRVEQRARIEQQERRFAGHLWNA